MDDILLQEKYIDKLKEDPNKWRVLREFMEELGINESERDVLQGFISVMFKENKDLLTQ